jgi:hypothetical protein
MSLPTLSRTAETIRRPSASSAGRISLPPLASAARSNGQIFIPVMPSSSSSRASSPGRCRKACRSSQRWPSSVGRPQLSERCLLLVPT